MTQLDRRDRESGYGDKGICESFLVNTHHLDNKSILAGIWGM